MESNDYLKTAKTIATAENTLFELCENLYEYTSAFNNFKRDNENFLGDVIDYYSIVSKIDSASSLFKNDLVAINSTSTILSDKIESLNKINLETAEKLKAILLMSEYLLTLALISKRPIGFYKIGVVADEKAGKVFDDDINDKYKNLKAALPDNNYELLQRFVSDFRFDFLNTNFLESYTAIILDEYTKIKPEADYILKKRDNVQIEITAVEEVLKTLLQNLGDTVGQITSELSEIKEKLDSLLVDHDEKEVEETILLLEKNANFMLNTELSIWSKTKDLNLLKEAFEITYGTWIYNDAFEEEGDLSKIERLIDEI